VDDGTALEGAGEFGSGGYPASSGPEGFKVSDKFWILE
jgi:hypothetical protein